jgi:hypothetical protein
MFPQEVLFLKMFQNGPRLRIRRNLPMCSGKQKPRSLGVVCERGKLPTPGVWLEVDLSSELEDSRVKGRRDLAEPAVT